MPIEYIFLYFFYTNIQAHMHNKNVFNNIPSQTFIFVAQDIHVQKHVLLNTNDKL
jgi:hypothetical protein